MDGLQAIGISLLSPKRAASAPARAGVRHAADAVAAIAALEAELGFALLASCARRAAHAEGRRGADASRSILRSAERLKAASAASRRAAAAAWNPADDFAGLRGAMHSAVAGDRAGTSWRTEDAPLPSCSRALQRRYDVVLTALGPVARSHRQSELAADGRRGRFGPRVSRGPVSPEILAGHR